jgi:L-Ala-D/L-Glu epimerase
VTGETPDGALARVTDEYGPGLIGRALPTRDVGRGLRALRDELHAGRPAPGAAWCAVETALLDALGHATGRSAADLLGGAVRRSVRYGGVAPFASGPVLAAMLLGFRLYGFRDVKLKLGRSAEQDEAAVRLARQILGPDVELRVDANCAWTADAALALVERLRPFEVQSYEQPVGASDVSGLARLSASLPEDIVVDESLCSLADARRLIAARACSVLNVRVSKCGGPLAALELVELASRAGLLCQLGAQVGESGILTAAGRLVAIVAEPGFRHHEGADNRFLLRRDLTAEDLTVRPGGRGDALTGPGLGVRVRRDALLALARRHATVGGPHQARAAARA